MTRLVPPLGEVFFSDRARPADEGSLARRRLVVDPAESWTASTLPVGVTRNA